MIDTAMALTNTRTGTAVAVCTGFDDEGRRLGRVRVKIPAKGVRWFLASDFARGRGFIGHVKCQTEGHLLGSAVLLGAGTTDLRVVQGEGDRAANIDFALGPFAWIFSIGELHRWHHSAQRDEADHNYGDTFIFWDGLFGTRYLPRDRPAPERVGIANLEAFPTGWWAQQLAPFRYRAIERKSASP